MNEAKALQVPIHAVTHHEYIEVDQDSFTSPTKLDVTGAIAKAVNASVATTLPGVQAWAGEIGPHNGGSVPCDHTSMRWANFGDSLWYMDAMALKAKHGYGAFCRQDLIGADYGITDCSTGAPLPDFWAGLIWTKTMGPSVLLANVDTPKATAIRAYAHCTVHAPGHATVLLINLADSMVNVTLSSAAEGARGATGKTRVEWHLTQTKEGFLTNSTGLLGAGMALNGNMLRATDSGSMPKLSGASVSSAVPVAVSGQSFVFVVIKAAGCA